MSRSWSLATQAIVLHILVIAVVVLSGSALALLDARRDGDEAARQQVVGIATSLADSPSTAAAIESGRATEILQPVTEAVRDEHRHRVHHDHGARPDPVHPHRPGPDRRAVHRHHRTRAAGRDVQRGLHRHARPVDSRGRAGARSVRPDRRAGVGGHHCSEAWPIAGAHSSRRSPRSALRRWLFRWSGCG